MPSISFLKSKSDILRHRPLIVGTLTGRLPLDTQIKIARATPVDLIEVRLDSFSGVYQPFEKARLFTRALLLKIKRLSSKPLLLTIRSFKEQGRPALKGRRLDDRARLSLFKSVLPECRLIDVEIRHLPLARALTPLARRRGVGVIHSYHDFSGPGSISQWGKWSRLSRQLKGNVFKIAVTPRTNEQLESFLSWGLKLEKPQPVLIAMGTVGFVSRFIGYSFGSILTYGHLGRSAAPGQVTASLLRERIDEIYS